MSCHPKIRRGQAALDHRGMQLLATSSVLALSLAAVQPLAAQTVDVNAPGNLTAATGTATPLNGAIWNLNSTGIFFNTIITLPAATPGLTINGNGNTLTPTGSNGFFELNAPGSMALSNITISGSTSSNGALFAHDSLTLNTTGAVALVNNTAGLNSGGAIAVLVGNLTMGSATSTITVGSNSAGVFGGAIWVNNGGATIDGSEITLSGNHTDNAGGAIHAFQDVVIGNASSTVTLLGNSAPHGGGIVALAGSVTLHGDTVTLTGNRALPGITTGAGAGGAIFGLNGITIDANNITVSDNHADAIGGGLDSAGPILVGNAGSTVSFIGNSAVTNDGGAIFATSSVTINGSSVTVNGNSAGGAGGAIDATGNVLIGNANSVISFTDNHATGGSGGAIFTDAAATLNGSTITLSNNTSEVNGSAISGREVTLTGGQITVSNNNASTGGGAIASSGNVALSGSRIMLSNNTSGGSGGAISADANVSISSGDGGAIALEGNTSDTAGGAIQTNVGTINIHSGVGGTIAVTGNTANGFGGAIAIGSGDVNISSGDSGVIALTGNTAAGAGGVIHVSSGNGNVSISSGNEGIISVTGNTAGGSFGGAINMQGDGSVSISTGTGGTITLADNRYLGVGGGGGAIFAFDGNVNVSSGAGGTIVMTRNTANGGGGAINALFGNVTLEGGQTTVSNNTAGLFGGAIYAGGDVTLHAVGGDFTFSGNMENTATTARANAIYLNNNGGATHTTFNAAAGNSITFFDPIQNNAANGLVSVLATGGGTVAFDGTLYSNLLDRWSQLYGTTEVQSGTTMAVRNNAVYGALAADVGGTAGGSSFTVDSGATLAGGIIGEVRADNFALNGTLNIAGAAPPGTASGRFSTFTVTSNNVSLGSGSQVLFNTYLNDASVQLTDLLTLNLNGSATSGTASIFVTNVGGPGGLTTNNGIELVHVTNDNGTTAGAFTLANPELRAGIHDYRLFHGGLDGSDPNNWFLRSTEGEGPPVVPPDVLPPEPPAPGPGTFPIIGPEIATYGVVQPMAQQLGRAMLGTHDERLSDLYRAPCEPAETNAPPYTKAPVYTKAPTTDCGGWRPAVWGRLFGQQIDNHYQAFADPRADGQIAGLQAGVDVLRSDSLIAGHTDYAGFYAGYGNANVDVSGLVTNAAATGYVLQHTGHLNLNAYSGGAYWTHYGPQGWYLDLTLQGTSYDSAASTEFARLSTSGSGFISSLEGGYPIALPQFGSSFVLEPQAQVLWQWVSFDAGNDGLGPVALGTTSTTTARVGVKGKWTITTDGGQVWQPYVRANYWSDFGGNPTTLFGVDSVPLISQAQYMDVDAGFTTRINTHISAFAEAGYQFAVSHDGGGKRDGVRGTAGLRYQW